MDLRTYINDLDRRASLAAAVARSPDYLYQLGVEFQGRKPSPHLAAEIENATVKLGPERVPAESMRTDYEFQRNRRGQVTGYFKRLG